MKSFRHRQELHRLAQYPWNSPTIAYFLGRGNRLIAKFRVSRVACYALAERRAVSKAAGLARIAFLVAAIGSLAVAVLLVAAHFGIWMEGANLHPTPRINALTVGLAFAPVPIFSWITYVWA